MRSRYTLLCLVFLLLPAQVASSSDRASYIDQLRQVEKTLQRAMRAQGIEREQTVHRALELIDRIEAGGPIDTPSGPVNPYLASVRDPLTKSPPAILKASQAVQNLVAAVEAPTRPADRARARAALEEVFRDPRLADSAVTWQERPLEKVLGFLRRILGGLSLGSVPSSALSLTQVLVLASSFALAAATVFFIVRSSWRHANRAGGKPQYRVPSSQQDAASMLALAGSYARAGDYREAVRANFVAVLLYLHEHGKLRYERSLTNREHLARIGQDTQVAGSLEPLVRTFEDVWYGNREVTAEQYARYQERADMVRARNS